jgi:organic radical activating enzyme
MDNREDLGAKNPWSFPFLRNIGLIMTYRCPIECAHCLVDASPYRKEEISLQDAFNWIRQISEYREGYVKILSLTGGEPFYNLDKLKKISSFAGRRGLLISVTTNAFWAETYEKAFETLRLFPEIKIITMSTDAYHLDFIPLERLSNAILAAEDNDTLYNLNVCTVCKEDTTYRDIMSYLEKVVSNHSINTTITIPNGRANKMVNRSLYKMEKDPPQIPCLSCSCPVITPTGKVLACCGAIQAIESANPLILGSLRDDSLSNILDEAELNPILHIIRLWGPDRLISMAKEAGLGRYLPESYIKGSTCDICNSLMTRKEIIDFLFQLAFNQEIRKLVAKARSLYLGETQAGRLSKD